MKRELNFIFLARLINHKGKECVTWPFSKDTHGYGTVYFRKRPRAAHRVMCELVNGPPPSSKHEAAHSCGNGHNGCVNPRHLSWKLHEDNMADMARHGRVNRHGRRKKLSDEQVKEIRALKGKMTYRQIAARYGVNHRTIGLIIIGRERPETPRATINKHIPVERRRKMQERARELRAQGLSYHNIGLEIGCSKRTAKTYSLSGRGG